MELERAAEHIATLKTKLAERYLGDSETIDLAISAWLSGGHILIEGAPGLGKTMLVRSMAQFLGLDFGRVQCTPDLMPGDITGGEVLDEIEGKKKFRFLPGPVFCHLFLADEINRATPRTQSALLEAMEERQVTAGGRSHSLGKLFFVAATQNPIELEGTYPLPEAQLDRFQFQLLVREPDQSTLERILMLPEENFRERGEALFSEDDMDELFALVRQIVVPEPFVRTLAQIIRASHPHHPEALAEVRDQVRFGASPRAGRAILAGARALAVMAGRAHVSPQDLNRCLAPALRHRLVLRYEARAAGSDPDALIQTLAQRFPIR